MAFGILILASLGAYILPIETMEIDGRVWELEVASEPIDQQRGLMHRRHFSSYRGMRFDFSAENRRVFWMKNVHQPLWIIWLDKNQQELSRVYASPCLQDPCRRYYSPPGVQFVVELPEYP